MIDCCTFQKHHNIDFTNSSQVPDSIYQLYTPECWVIDSKACKLNIFCQIIILKCLWKGENFVVILHQITHLAFLKPQVLGEECNCIIAKTHVVFTFSAEVIQKDQCKLAWKDSRYLMSWMTENVIHFVSLRRKHKN